jgi:hypothetical protein
MISHTEPITRDGRVTQCRADVYESGKVFFANGPDTVFTRCKKPARHEAQLKVAGGKTYACDEHSGDLAYWETRKD